jgi:hypothetical protein
MMRVSMSYDNLSVVMSNLDCIYIPAVASCVCVCVLACVFA